MVLSQGVSLLTNLRFIYQVAADTNMEGKDLKHKSIYPAGYESGSQSEESDRGSEYVDSDGPDDFY